MLPLLGISTILDGDIDLAQQLAEWVEDKKFRWQLCYQASRDGWRSVDFHINCDDVGPTVTLVKCGTNIFGGYTDRSWKSLPPHISPSSLAVVAGMFLLLIDIIYNSYFLTLHCST